MAAVIRNPVLLASLLASACGSAGVGDGDDLVADAQPDASPPALRCLPNSDGPYWLEEGQTVTAQLRCDGALPLAEAGLTISNLPLGAVLDPATGVLTWTPALDQGATWRLGVTATATSEAGVVVIGVADAYDTPGNVPIVDATTYTHEFGLPVIHLRWHSDDPNYCLDSGTRDDVPADITAFGHVYAGGALRCRGAASINFPKKSFTVTFGPGDHFDPPPGMDEFADRKRVVLTQTFDDVSYVRTRLAFAIWNALDADHIQLAQASAVVFVDGAYWGLYQLTDHVDDDSLDAQGLSGTGNLYKAYSHAGNLRAVYGDGSPKGNLADGYEKKEGEPIGDYTDLGALLTWVTTSTDADFAATIDDHLHTSDFVDWYVFATAIMAQDSYGKNSYLHHDPARVASRWRYAPWDMNHALGQTWQSYRVGYADEGRFDAWPMSTNGVWNRMAAQPAMAAIIDDRFTAALAGPMSKTAVIDMLTSMQAEIEASALRDQRKWGAAMQAFPWWSSRTDFNDFDGEIAYVAQWVSQRWDYLATLY